MGSSGRLLIQSQPNSTITQLNATNSNAAQSIASNTSFGNTIDLTDEEDPKRFNNSLSSSPPALVAIPSTTQPKAGSNKVTYVTLKQTSSQQINGQQTRIAVQKIGNQYSTF